MQTIERNIRRLTGAEVEKFESAATGVEKLQTRLMDSAVYGLSSKATTDGDEALAGTYRFIASILRPSVASMNKIDTITNQFWVTPASLTDEEVELLRELTASIKDPELRARLADFLWLRTRDWKYGEISVDDYLASAMRLRDPEKWPACAHRYERAAALAASLGKKNERFTRTIKVIEDYLADLDGEDPLFLSEHLMSTLLDHKEGDRRQYAALAGKCALAAEQRGNFYLALHYWNLKVRWHAALSDSEGERSARIAAAESVIKDGETRLIGETPSYVAAADFVQRGLAMLQKAGAPEERINELAARLKEYQAKSLDELKPLGSKFDATEMINEARAAVAGKSLPEAITAFVDLPHLPKRDATRREVLKRAKQFVFSHIFGEIQLNRDGAAVAGRGSVSGDETDETNNVLALMYQDVVQGFSIQAQTTVGPAWRQIQDEHYIHEQDMAVIVHQSWFVPPEREEVFAKGLTTGFNGDLVTAIHLLVPQIEPTIRWQLQQRRVNTMRLNRDGYHEERDLNQLLGMPEAKNFLGDRVHFALTAILTSRFGYYLRHKLAHGLMEPQECYSVICLFFWALILHICVRTLPKPQEPASRE
jgi:hypothetical protein